MAGSQARNWCFTLNNWTEPEYNVILNLDVGFLIMGKETGENGTPHLQGYVQFHKRTYFTTAQKLLPRAHLEVAYGSADSNIEYCTKGGDHASTGLPKRRGERTDLNKVRRDALENGMTGVTRWANAQQIKVAEKFLTYNEPARDWKPTVTWIYGGPGSGKTRTAHELTGECRYIKKSGGKWWNGYDDHEDVIIDDFRDSWWDLEYLLGLIDRYAFRVEFKGGCRQFRARNIVITAPRAPETYYPNMGEDMQQLLRRIDVIMPL